MLVNIIYKKKIKNVSQYLMKNANYRKINFSYQTHSFKHDFKFQYAGIQLQYGKNIIFLKTFLQYE
jgi:hypothetical protein